MIEIDRNVDYSSHGYRFRNFINRYGHVKENSFLA